MKVVYQDFDNHIKMSTVYDAFGYIVTAFLVYWLPRKFLHISLIIFLGSALILGAALPSEELPFYQYLLTMCRCLGNPAIALFCLHIAEMFPTEVRSTAVGVIGSAGYLTGYYASSIGEFWSVFFCGLIRSFNLDVKALKKSGESKQSSKNFELCTCCSSNLLELGDLRPSNLRPSDPALVPVLRLKNH